MIARKSSAWRWTKWHRAWTEGDPLWRCRIVMWCPEVTPLKPETRIIERMMGLNVIIFVFPALLSTQQQTVCFSAKGGIPVRPDNWFKPVLSNVILFQEKRLKANSVRELLRRMTRKPRPAQFYALMGRRSLGKAVFCEFASSNVSAVATHLSLMST